MVYKDKPLKLRNVTFLKITHLKYYGNRISVTQSSRPLIPPSLKRLVKAVGLRSVKTRCGATCILRFLALWGCSKVSLLQNKTRDIFKDSQLLDYFKV